VTVLDDHATRIAALEAEMVRVRERGLEYFGTWQPGQYRPGSVVTHGGHLWIARVGTSATPGGSSEGARAWTMAVRRPKPSKANRQDDP
jgi:hypothetical protein